MDFDIHETLLALGRLPTVARPAVENAVWVAEVETSGNRLRHRRRPGGEVIEDHFDVPYDFRQLVAAASWFPRCRAVLGDLPDLAGSDVIRHLESPCQNLLHNRRRP